MIIEAVPELREDGAPPPSPLSSGRAVGRYGRDQRGPPRMPCSSRCACPPGSERSAAE